MDFYDKMPLSIEQKGNIKMKASKANIIILNDWYPLLQYLSHEEVGTLLMFMLEKHIFDLEPDNIPDKLIGLYEYFMKTVESYNEKYEAKVERAMNAAESRRLKKEAKKKEKEQKEEEIKKDEEIKESEPEKEIINETKEASDRDFSESQTETRESVQSSVASDVNTAENFCIPDQDFHRTALCNTVPTQREVEDFCRQHRLKINPRNFYDYNQHRLWMNNGKKIMNWQGLALSWDANSRRQEDKRDDDFDWNKYMQPVFEKFENKENTENKSFV